jgi:hypothetical protein
VIVKVIGLSIAGECVERQADTLIAVDLKKAARAMAKEYLTTWPTVAKVVIRQDIDHKIIVTVKRNGHEA